MNMSRGPQTFRQRDLARVMKAVAAAGMTVAGVKVDKDGFVVLTGKSDNNSLPAKNEWLTDDTD